MWFYVTDTGEAANEKRKFLVQIEYRNLDPQLIARGSMRQVEVEVEAPEKVMNQLNYDSILCEVDLRGRSPGKYREIVRAKAPQNVAVTSVIPSVMDIELLRQAGRVFSVELALPQDIPAGRYLEAVEIVPRELNVKGTEKDLAKIGSIVVAPTLKELENGKDLLLPVKITQSEPFEDEVIVEPAQVRLNAALVTGLPRKKVGVNVRLSGKPSPDYAVRFVLTDPAEVMVQGDKAKLAALSAVDTELVNIAGIAANQTMQVPLRPFKDKGLSLLDNNSVKISVQLERIKAQRQISGVPVVIDGQGAEKWAAAPAIVDVTIEAPPSLMETFDSKKFEIRAFVDVSNVFLRKMTLPVRAAVSGDFGVVKIEPSTVTVNVNAVE
jgi:YbbR domain-containing protein